MRTNNPSSPKGIGITMSRNTVEILLVEDNQTDAELVREALSSWRSPSHLSVVEDGEEALLYLKQQNGFTESTAPRLIFLDLNLPKKDGMEVLREIKNDERLSSIPVIVLTTSDRENDVQAAYRLHANCYLTKPLEIDEFIEKVKAVEEFWVRCARLPGRKPR